MDAKTRSMLNDSEQELLRATTATAMRGLDEDALADLHDRVRRARSKYIKMHRRRGASQVATDRSRTRADSAGERTAIKAEVFEDALARVSAQLAKVAAKAAETLKAERLAAAAAVKSPPPAKGSSAKGTKQTPAGKSKSKKVGGSGGSTSTDRARGAKPVEKKRVAASRATQQRSSAKRSAKR